MIDAVRFTLGEERMPKVTAEIGNVTGGGRVGGDDGQNVTAACFSDGLV